MAGARRQPVQLYSELKQFNIGYQFRQDEFTRDTKERAKKPNSTPPKNYNEGIPLFSCREIAKGKGGHKEEMGCRLAAL
jgi:hypothetical protein